FTGFVGKIRQVVRLFDGRGLVSVAETGDVYDALADKYLAIGCSCVSPNDQRLQMLSQMVEEYQVDGVV
ncbi:2-hydroxyacyl-CoA dehydratase, partial [Klebsiella pneumoniae]|uniref:2-hydroxyacyl-CoA dehydratase n=1 Tax=Klebsiella pneumoniae TaxID=573 RepID=UPI001D0DAF2F